MRLAAFAQPGKYAALGIIHDQPFEAVGLTIERVQCWHAAVEPIEVADQGVNPTVAGLLSEMPIQRMVVSPFVLLAELASHEQEFLARMAEHKPIVSAQISE